MLVLAIGDFHIPDRASEIPPKFKKLLSGGKIGQVLCLGNVTDNQTLAFLQGISSDYQAVKGEFDMSPSLPLNKVVTHGQLRIGFVAGHSVIPNSDPDALLITARQLDVDMLIWGGSHRVEAHQLEGKFFINPGSATGAFSTRWPEALEAEDESQEEVSTENDYSQDKGKGTSNGDTNDEEEGTSKTKADDNDKANNTDDNNDDGEDDEEDDILTSTVPSFCLLDIQGSVCVLYIYSLIDGDVKVDKVSYRKEVQ